MDELELKSKIESIAELYYKTYRPPKMTFEEVLKLAEKAYEYVKDEEKALNIMDEALDPELTYTENMIRLRRYIKGEEIEEKEKLQVGTFPFEPPENFEEFYKLWMENYKKFKYR